MNQRIIAFAVCILMLLTLVPVCAAEEGYAEPKILPVQDTYIRANAPGDNFSANSTMVVDASESNRRLSFLEFSLTGYENYINTAEHISLNLLSLSDAAGENYSFSLYPLCGAFKELDLRKITWTSAKDIMQAGERLTDYAPEDAEIYVGKKYNWYSLDITDYCKGEADFKLVFMLRSHNGAFQFYSKEMEGCEPYITFDSGFTKMRNEVLDAAIYASTHYEGVPVSENLDFIHKYNGKILTYTSAAPQIIEHDGTLLARPAENEEDLLVSFTVRAMAPEQPEFYEEKSFSVIILKTGSYAASSFTVSSKGAEIIFEDFDGFRASNKKVLLQLDNTLMKAGGSYTLLSENNNEILHFIPRIDTNQTVLDVTEDLSGRNGRITFTMTSEAGFFAENLPRLLVVPKEEAVTILELNALDLGDLSQVTESFMLPGILAETELYWQSSEQSIISHSGRVQRPAVDTWVDLTVSFSNGVYSYSTVFKVYVLREHTELPNNEYPAISDPMHMSDEELFGEWNAGTYEWKTTPILRYDSVAGLSGVENAVKKGDYDLAKTLLLAHYRGKSGDDRYALKTEYTYQVQTNALLNKMDGWTGMDAFIGEVTVGEDWGWYTFDIDPSVLWAGGCYWIMDMDMDGSYLEIASKEYAGGGYGAYLEIVTGGKHNVYPITNDTYLSAGIHGNNKYGDAELLYCREAAGDKETPFCMDTARPYFSRPQLRLPNTTSVKFSFYGRSVGKPKLVYLLTSRDFRNFDEDEVYWNMHNPQIFNFKETGYIWRAPQGFHQSKWRTAFEFVNSLSRCGTSGYLIQNYKTTGQEEMAYRAFEFIAELYRQQPYAGYPRNLDSAWRVEQILRTFYTGINSEHMTPEVLTLLVKDLYAHGKYLTTQSVTTAANWESAIQSNLAKICAYMPEITQEGWWDTVKKKLYNFYSEGVMNEDGSYTESTSSYIDGVLDEFEMVLDIMAAREGIDSEDYQFFAVRYTNLVEYLMNLCYADGNIVPWGDGSKGDSRPGLKQRVDYLDNPAVRYFATMGKEGKEPSYTSILYPKKALAMLRSGWHENDLCAFMSNCNGGSHGHRDDLALDVTAYGKYLLVDAGGSAYSEGSEFATRRFDTLYHNTIEIDNVNQNMYMLAFPGTTSLKTNNSFDFLYAGNTSIYPGFDVNRKVLMLKNKYLIVSDYIFAPAGSHTYRQAWQPDADSNIKMKTDTGMAYTNYANGANIKVIPADPEECKSFLFDRLDSSNNTFWAIQYLKENVEGDQTYDTILYPEEEGSDIPISVKRLPMNVPRTTATAIAVTMDENIGYYYSSNEEIPSVRSFDKFSYNGEMAYVETSADGNVTYIAMTDGSELYSDGTVLIKADKTVNDLSVTFENGRLLITSSEAFPEGKIRLLASNAVSHVYFNSGEIQYTLENGYIVTDGTRASGNQSGSIRPGSPGGQGRPAGGGEHGTTQIPSEPKPPEKPILSDLKGHWAEKAISALYEKGIVSGDETGRFRPDDKITRAEFIKLLVGIMGLELPKQMEELFVDVSETGWYAPYIEAARIAGVAEGYADGSFRPNNQITRQEMAKMLAAGLGTEIINGDTASRFADSADIASWAFDAVSYVAEIGLFVGDEQGNFYPERDATRAESATVIYRALEIFEGKGQ